MNTPLNRLTDMEYDEVSLVGVPANQLGKIVLMKSHAEPPATGLLIVHKVYKPKSKTCKCGTHTGSERNAKGEKVCERCGMPQSERIVKMNPNHSPKDGKFTSGGKGGGGKAPKSSAAAAKKKADVDSLTDAQYKKYSTAPANMTHAMAMKFATHKMERQVAPAAGPKRNANGSRAAVGGLTPSEAKAHIRNVMGLFEPRLRKPGKFDSGKAYTSARALLTDKGYKDADKIKTATQLRAALDEVGIRL